MNIFFICFVKRVVHLYDSLNKTIYDSRFDIFKLLQCTYGKLLSVYTDKKSPSLRVIQALRDEAHRFGITHHRDRRSKSQTVSELDSIATRHRIRALDI